MRLTHPHFRIEFPEQFKGSRHVANRGRVFVSFPEIGEVELPSVRRVEIGELEHGLWEVELRFLASAEVQYVKDESAGENGQRKTDA